MKRLKRIFIFIFMLFIITGCVKMDVSMTINKDKSMNVTIIEAFDESLANQSDTEILTEEDKKEFEEMGFTVEDYNEEGMIGAKIYRDIKNIDEVSKEEEVEFSLDFSNEEENYMFQVKKGFFKNTYKAKIESLDTDSLTEDITGSEDTTIDDYDSYDDYDYDYDYTSDDTNSDYDLSDFDYEYLLSSMDLKMKVNLPYKALNNNATTVENDGKNLIWDLTKTGDAPIEFEFELYNIGNIILVGVGVLVLIVILIIMLIKKKGKKNKNTVQPQPTQQVNNPVPNNNIPNQMSNNMVGGNLVQNNNINEQNLQQQSINNVQTNSFVDKNNQEFIPTNPQPINPQPLANDTSNTSVQQNSFIQPAQQEFIQPTPEPVQTTNMPIDNTNPNIPEQKNNSIDDLFNMVPVQESNTQPELNNNQPTQPTNHVPEVTNNISTQNDALTGNVVPEIQPILPTQPETTNGSTNLSNVPTENQTLQSEPQAQPLEQNSNTMNFNNILSENQNNQDNQIFPQ